MNSQYILITGRLNTGKSTLATNIRNRIIYLENLPRKVLIFHLADKIREELLTLNPWIQCLDHRFVKLRSLVEKFGWTLAKKEPEVRVWLQSYGENQRYWTKPTRWSANVPVTSKNKIVIIPDIRTIEEIEYIFGLATNESLVKLIFLEGNKDKTGSHLTESLTPEIIENYLLFKACKLHVVPETKDPIQTANLAWKALNV